MELRLCCSEPSISCFTTPLVFSIFKVRLYSALFTVRCSALSHVPSPVKLDYNKAPQHTVKMQSNRPLWSQAIESALILSRQSNQTIWNMGIGSESRAPQCIYTLYYNGIKRMVRDGRTGIPNLSWNMILPTNQFCHHTTLTSPV